MTSSAAGNRLERQLGEGAMGAVRAATTHTVTKKAVALKRLRTQQADLAVREGMRLDACNDLGSSDSGAATRSLFVPGRALVPPHYPMIDGRSPSRPRARMLLARIP